MLTELDRPKSETVVAATDHRPHAIVIGAGFGGLAAAIRAGARGYRVTVVDKLDKPGGRGYAFSQDGFSFDAGPTIVTAPHIFEELWGLCGRRMEDDITLAPADPFYRVRFDDGFSFDCSADHARMCAQIEAMRPEDVAGFERFLQSCEPLYRIGFEELSHQPFHNLLRFLSWGPDMVWQRADRSIYRHVARFVKDERLRFILSFHPLFVGGNPFRTTCVYGLISHLERVSGIHFCMGGTGKLVQGLADLVEGQGNRILLNTEVDEILVEQGRARGVRLADGQTLGAEIVISNADVAWTYRRLLRAHPRRKWTDARLDRMAYSNGLFIWYFGTDRRYDDVALHTISLAPRYRGLIDDIFKHRRLAEDFSLYLYRPTAMDPSMAPEGCDSFYVLAPVPNLLGDTDWASEAEPFRKRVAAALSATLLPDLEQHVVTSKVATPLDFQNRLLSYRGAGFSFEPLLWQSGWFRPHNRSEDVDGLFFVGAGTHPGAGLPGCIMSAKVLEAIMPHAEAYA